MSVSFFQQLTLFFFSSLILTCMIIPLLIHLSHRLGIVDHPSERKIHSSPIPHLGGVSLFLSTFIVLTLYSFHSLQAYFPLFLGGSLMLGLGLWDDLYHLKARTKLLGQILICTLTWSLGLGLFYVKVPFTDVFYLGWMSLPLSVLIMIGVINALNLIDGLDGLASGLSIITFLTFTVFCFINQQFFICMILISLLGAVFGFLAFNFPPAKIFLGNSGSLFLGFMIGGLLIHGIYQQAISSQFFIPLLVLAIPILDVINTIWRRLKTKKNIFSPDLGHIHHILLDSGHSQRRVLTILYSLTVIMSVISITLYFYSK